MCVSWQSRTGIQKTSKLRVTCQIRWTSRGRYVTVSHHQQHQMTNGCQHIKQLLRHCDSAFLGTILQSGIRVVIKVYHHIFISLCFYIQSCSCTTSKGYKMKNDLGPSDRNVPYNGGFINTVIFNSSHLMEVVISSVSCWMTYHITWEYLAPHCYILVWTSPKHSRLVIRSMNLVNISLR